MSCDPGRRTMASHETALILASASPRRKQLLEEAGYVFEVDPAGIDEPEPIRDCRPGSTRPIWRGARRPRSRGAGQAGLILGADTVCVVDGEILNKPLDRADAERMIRLQEGRQHARDLRHLPLSRRSP